MTNNSASGSFTGPVVQFNQARDVYIGGAQPVRSNYLRLVKDTIAPVHLAGREAELAHLAEFCTAPDTRGRYLWWQAEAWSGKTALLSWFVLNPPPDVVVVSFFVRASPASQSDRRALVDNLREQLIALLGHVPQPQPTESTGESYLLGLLQDVARDCDQRGQHLVLVVDGLDEDRGVDRSPEAGSVAALLPIAPEAMRVVVAGRSSPPLPHDVPNHHPLRDPGIIRQLAPSPAATAEQGAMERDLKRLLRGSVVEQDLLGLLAAAGGGLSTPDLVALTGALKWEIEDLLGTAAGRSFRRRAQRGTQASEVYVFAHERLLVNARMMLSSRLAEFRARLDIWADRYANRQWPADTPDYLLRDYFGLLTGARELPRMLAYATDPYRHHRLLACTGTDGSSLAEISAVQHAVLAAEGTPDLVALARLAVHRVHLHRVNSQIHYELPAGWARIGEFERAESMLLTIREPGGLLRALAATARMCHFLGETQRAETLLRQAEENAQGLDQFFGARSIQSVAEAFQRTGDEDGADRVVGLINDSAERAETLALVATHAAAKNPQRAAALLDEAERLVRMGRSLSPGALVDVAAAVRRLGQGDRALDLLEEAESALADGTTFDDPPPAWCVANAGDYDRALRFVERIADRESREQAAVDVASVVAAQDGNRAEAIARTAETPLTLCRGLSAVAAALPTHDRDRAVRLIADAENTADRILDPSNQAEAFIAIAAALAEMGSVDRALSLVGLHAGRIGHADSLLPVAGAMLNGNNLDVGRELLLLVEHASRREPSPYDERRSVLWIKTMADAGDFDRAENHTKTFTDRAARSAAWAAIAEAAVISGDLDRAEQAILAIEETPYQRRPRLDLIRTLLAIGDVDRATSVARLAADLEQRVIALTTVAQDARRTDLLDEIEQNIDSSVEPANRLQMMLDLLKVTAALGYRARMTTLMDRIRSRAQQQLDDGPEGDRRATSKLSDLVDWCSSRRPTVTEIAETVPQLTIRSRHQSDDHYGHIVPGVWPTPRDYSDLSPVEAAARRLSEQDWCYEVQTLVDLCPDTYLAIVAELDSLTQARAATL